MWTQRLRSAPAHEIFRKELYKRSAVHRYTRYFGMSVLKSAPGATVRGSAEPASDNSESASGRQCARAATGDVEDRTGFRVAQGKQGEIKCMLFGHRNEVCLNTQNARRQHWTMPQRIQSVGSSQTYTTIQHSQPRDPIRCTLTVGHSR